MSDLAEVVLGQRESGGIHRAAFHCGATRSEACVGVIAG
jgi:hypothetical protein